MQSSIRINSPAAVKIVYTIVYAFYACISLFIALYLARVPEFRRFKALIFLYWILITCTIVEGIYFGIMISKLKSKLVSYCDDRTAPANRGGPPGTETDSGNVIMPTTTKPITCHRNQALFVSVFYVLGPGGWLILHISWILVVVLYSKALRRRYPSAGDEDTTKVLPYHNSHLSQYQDPASKQGFVRPSSPMSGAWNTIHRTFSSHSQLNSGKDNRATEMGVIPGVHPYQTHPSQEATYQQGGDKVTLQRPSASARTSSVLRSPFKRGSTDALAQGQTSDLQHIDSDDESESSDDEGDEEGLARGRHQSRTDGSTSTVSTGVAGEIPADGKGWWLRQMEGKKRGEFCPCMNTSELRVTKNEACWCGKERHESHARLSVASGSASGSGSGSRPSPSFSAPRALSPAGPSSSRPSSSSVTLPREPSPVHHQTEPRQD
ncbi:hypothetical protein BG006_011053 [Podila minutissima]|uniref:Uncharacterized protein n=1 Tax=Podila minutissima TaxID=64525 RepID=A0A9P5VPL6_9FUNG|nr:hypothetical protein BG006_011053 [Podila minutissima]